MQCKGVVKVMPTGLPKQIYSVQVIGFNLSLYNPFFSETELCQRALQGEIFAFAASSLLSSRSTYKGQ